MESTEGFEAFVAVVDAGSIAEAARALGLPRPTLSRQLARLEDRLGVRLLHRGTRNLPLTRAGEELYRRARPVVEAGRAAVEAVQRLDDVPRGLLRVAGPPAADGTLNGLVLEFLRANPEVRVEYSASNRHVDLRAEGWDVAIRAGVLRDPGLIARLLMRAPGIVVASPAYLAAHGTPRTPADLAAHNCVVGFEGGLRPQPTWPTPTGDAVPVRGRLASDDVMMRARAAHEGLGLALLPEALVAGDVEAGSLVHVLAGEVGFDGGIYAVYVEREHLDPKVRAFVDLAAGWFRRVGPWRMP